MPSKFLPAPQLYQAAPEDLVTASKYIDIYFSVFKDEPSSLLTTKTTVSLTSGTADASAHFTSIFNDDVSASSLANTSTLLVTNWTTALMTSLFDDNTTISVIVISILVIFVLALVVCLVLGVRWKLCSVCYQSPLSAGNIAFI